jgi:hypothetical protein
MTKTHIMQKVARSFTYLLPVCVLVIAFTNGVAFADSDQGSKYPIDVSASSASAPADGKTTITFYLFIYGYYCADTHAVQEGATCADGTTSTTKSGKADHWIGIYPSGNGNTFTGIESPAGVQYVTSDSNGKAQFQLSSSVAETKTLKFTDHVPGVPYANAATATVTFTPVVSQQTPQQQAATPASQLPAAPRIVTVKVNDEPVTDKQTITFGSDQTLKLEGSAVPNGVLVLKISSEDSDTDEPTKTDNVTADGLGNWTYEVKDLDAGSYHIDGDVTDPKTNKTSAQAVLASFTVTNSAEADEATSGTAHDSTKKKTSPLVWILGGLGIIAAAGLAAWGYLRWRKKRQASPKKATTTNPSQTTAVPSENEPEDTSKEPRSSHQAKK